MVRSSTCTLRAECSVYSASPFHPVNIRAASLQSWGPAHADLQSCCPVALTCSPVCPTWCPPSALASCLAVLLAC
jgi:hypothetical protein